MDSTVLLGPAVLPDSTTATYLLVHEGEVILQLAVVGNHDALPLGVVLGPSSSSQHL